MILYFSATGNSKYVAQRIAKALNDKAVSIEHHNGNIILSEKEYFGIVTPTHFWELPVIMREFLEKLTLTLSKENYIFMIATYGSIPGCCGTDTKKMLARKNISLNGAFSVKMPDSWTPFFDLSNPQKVQKQNNNAEVQIDKVIAQLKARKMGNHATPKAPYFLRGLTDSLFGKARQTTNFYVEETCIGCGICVKRCPVQAIELKNNKPVWIKEQCALCLRCLHACPKFAIQYGNGKTKKHGQYKHPDFTKHERKS